MRLGRGGWRNFVTNMVIRGAPLNGREADTVIEYLTANFGPTAAPPRPRPGHAPAGGGKELVETRCTVCHDLERVATIKRPKNYWPGLVASMVVRGAPVSAEEAQTITAYCRRSSGSNARA